ILKEKPHVLSKETESVLSLGGQVFGAFRDIFTMIDNADMPLPTIKLGGEKVTVSHGLYGVLLKSPDRKIRKEVFKKYYGAYRSLLKTITATYAGNVNKNVFIARARNYSSCLEMALLNEDVSVKVYENLLKSVHKALPELHRYVRQKKKALGLKSMHMYDIYVPTVEDCELSLDYEDAFKLVKKGLAPLGEDYLALLQQAHDDGWIDVEETDGKRSGAYSMGVYALKHPYVLLNYQKTTGDVFTIAHELGHALHTYHSNKYQPQSKADYKIFVAEVASTVNEVLLLKYLLKTSTDQKLRKYLLSYYTDMIKSTLFRQTMFAEFEYLAHDMAAAGEPLTDESLSQKYLELNKRYYGRSVVSDNEISYEWARIPHFYNAFYVYKYATGIISAISIAERIYSLGAPAVADYKKFLSSGGSDSPVELLKLAGVDLTKMAAYDLAMKSFKNALDEYESIQL
ncbi:MAG: oligoendopeptidase F, partial [Clostridia bacterium]|nr:oligoendopeptidase F [Clostridia bacterium]